MRRFVPYHDEVPDLDEEDLECIAEELLADFERARGVTIVPPTPIEDIVEKYLKLGLDFGDLHKKEPVIFVTIFGRRRIFIDESLDPEVNPSMEARYRFMLAHVGGGHGHLHLHLFDRKRPPTMFRDYGKALFTCQSGHAKTSEEWQADYYACCLLMPRRMVFAAWEELFPDRKPRVLEPQTPVAHPFVEIQRTHTSLSDFDIWEGEEKALERFCRPLAERFVVSPIAMRIRLEKLGLLLRAVPHQRLLLSE